ncbi:MAG: E3 ubiquitin-protein ligase rad18 [Trizodia sp. TS-e1964]|nr:MAG: E3 ubiquitin-protein ligase rad18 [Trizodia sp. TS-e1964]
MANPPQIPDSTDWLDTPLSGFAAVEVALRCQVCKEFYTTPLLTSCSHTFCSLCIRRCLSNDGKCPTCRASLQEVQLRRNGVLEELVDAFKATRAAALKIARAGTPASVVMRSPVPPKRKLDEMDMAYEDAASSSGLIRTRSRRRKIDSVAPNISLENGTSIPLEIIDLDLVPCPICNRRMKNAEVYSHLDTCESEPPIETVNSRWEYLLGELLAVEIKLTQGSRLPIGRAKLQMPPSQHPPRRIERLPKLNYSLFKESALRKKLSELGISTAGNKALMERRHTEWVNLWNSNCDALRPKQRRELLHEIEAWDRSQGHAISGLSGFTSENSGSDLMKKDFDAAGWAAKHDSEFQQLIMRAQAMRKPRVKSVEPAPSASVDRGPQIDPTRIQATPPPLADEEPGVLDRVVVDVEMLSGFQEPSHAPTALIAPPLVPHDLAPLDPPLSAQTTVLFDQYPPPSELPNPVDPLIEPTSVASIPWVTLKANQTASTAAPLITSSDLPS